MSEKKTTKGSMKAEELIKHSEALFGKLTGVMRRKNADYSASDENAFRNFEAVEYFGIAETKVGMMVRLTDKFTRIVNLLKKNGVGAVQESLQDSIEDAINYLAILHARLESEKPSKTRV